MAWQAVREDAAEEQEHDGGHLPRGQDEPEVGRGAMERVENRERERDRCHRAAEPRCRLSDEEEPKLALAQRAEPAHSGERQFARR